MKSLINIVGVLLIVIGIVALSYQGFSYNKEEKVAQFGDLQITAKTKERVYFPPLLGGLCLVGGVVLLIVGRISKK
ncbi:MAG: DUF3185 domain-containing protein [Gammaproteobacteria bacterium]|jgi:uncharacterized membrane protein|nr:DUF3185 domain-containing protein [Gammaproteobacteria bacterium]